MHIFEHLFLVLQNKYRKLSSVLFKLRFRLQPALFFHFTFYEEGILLNQAVKIRYRRCWPPVIPTVHNNC